MPVTAGPSRWRRYGGAVTREPRPDGHIVQLVNLPTRFEAEAVIGMLRDHDIQAMGKYGDAEGWMPHMALLDGYRVFVFDSDLDARERAGGSRRARGRGASSGATTRYSTRSVGADGRS